MDDCIPSPPAPSWTTCRRDLASRPRRCSFFRRTTTSSTPSGAIAWHVDAFAERKDHDARGVPAHLCRATWRQRSPRPRRANLLDNASSRAASSLIMVRLEGVGLRAHRGGHRRRCPASALSASSTIRPGATARHALVRRHRRRPSLSRAASRGLGGDVRVLPEGASVEGMFLGGAAFSLDVAKWAPTVVVDAGS